MLNYFIGLDLGQAQDFTALSVIERSGESIEDYKFNCLHLQRWTLRTTYPAIVAETIKLLGSAQLASHPKTLAIDNTGVGAPVVDLFRRESIGAKLKPIQIVGGSNISTEGDVTRVPKRDLVSSVQVNLQNRRLKIAAGLPAAAHLSQELSNFRLTITESANDTYGGRSGTNDDLVLSIALALWTANQPVYEPEEEYSECHRIYW